MTKRFFPVLITLLPFLSACFNGESTKDIPAVTNFDLKKYMGIWYEIARYPHSFEKDLSHVSAEYVLQKNQTVAVINRGRKNGREKVIRGIAKAEKKHCGELKVSFFRPFYGKYRIIYLNEKDAVAIVTSSSKKYLWVLARKKEIPEEMFREAVRFIESKGFRKDLLIRVDQTDPPQKKEDRHH